MARTGQCGAGVLPIALRRYPSLHPLSGCLRGVRGLRGVRQVTVMLVGGVVRKAWVRIFLPFYHHLGLYTSDILVHSHLSIPMVRPKIMLKSQKTPMKSHLVP